MPISQIEIIRFLPPIIMGAGILVLMMLASVRRHAGVSFYVCLLTLSIAALIQIGQYPQSETSVTVLFKETPTSGFFSLLVYLSCLSVTIMQRRYFEGNDSDADEFYLLLLLSGLGGLLLVMADHAAGILLGSELMGLSMLAMLVFNRKRVVAIEASIKYLILSGAATSMMVLGLALLYGGSGSLTLTGMFAGEAHTLTHIGGMMLLAALAFKLSLVPLHIWTADVYHGGQSNAVLLLTTLSKTAVFAITLAVMQTIDSKTHSYMAPLLTGIAVVSMIIGNWLALQQSNLKRLMAYSAIAHMGYVMVAAVVALSTQRIFVIEGASYYLLAYLIASILIFSVITQRSTHASQSDNETLDDYRGLFWRHPWQAITLTLAMLSLAGMPITIGFIGKFYVLSLAVEYKLWWLLTAMIIGSGLGLYYYLRVIFSLYQDEPCQVNSGGTTVISRIWLVSLGLSLIMLGILPGILGDALPVLLGLNK